MDESKDVKKEGFLQAIEQIKEYLSTLYDEELGSISPKGESSSVEIEVLDPKKLGSKDKSLPGMKDTPDMSNKIEDSSEENLGPGDMLEKLLKEKKDKEDIEG